MAKFMSVRGELAKSLGRRFRAGQSVLKAPLLESRGAQAVKLLRFSQGGIRDQFTAQAEMRGSSVIPWERTKPFGTKKAPRSTMQGKGDYRRSWLGGPGSLEQISANMVKIGVDRGLHPQVAIHQGSRTSVTVKPRQKTKNGDWKMRFFLGLTYGVWLSKARIERGLKIARRRLSISTPVRKAIARMVAVETKRAMSVGVQGPKAVA